MVPIVLMATFHGVDYDYLLVLTVNATLPV